MKNPENHQMEKGRIYILRLFHVWVNNVSTLVFHQA